MDEATGIVEEDIDSVGTRVFNRCSEVGGFLVIETGIEADFATPLQFIVVPGNGDRTASCQFGDFADKLTDCA
jgi:hypothetical protein